MAYDPITGPPSGRAMPGAVALSAYIRSMFGGLNSGIYNPRDVCGNPWPKNPDGTWKPKAPCAASAHAEGRGIDIGIRPLADPLGTRIADWCVDNFQKLGVQEVIWNRRRWASNKPNWAAYSGRSNHDDHVHITLTRRAAESLNVGQLFAETTPPAPQAPKPPTTIEEIQIMAESQKDLLVRIDRKDCWLLCRVHDGFMAYPLGTYTGPGDGEPGADFNAMPPALQSWKKLLVELAVPSDEVFSAKLYELAGNEWFDKVRKAAG